MRWEDAASFQWHTVHCTVECVRTPWTVWYALIYNVYCYIIILFRYSAIISDGHNLEKFHNNFYSRIIIIIIQNGYWFSTGWCVLFSVLAVVLGLVLSDYFRRAGTRVVKCTDTGTASENTSLIPYEDDENV